MQKVRLLMRDGTSADAIDHAAGGLEWIDAETVWHDAGDYLERQWDIARDERPLRARATIDRVMHCAYVDILGDDVTDEIIRTDGVLPLRPAADGRQVVEATDDDAAAAKKLSLAAVSAQVLPIPEHEACFRAGLSHGDPWVRRAAAFAAGFTEQPRYRSLLQAALNKETDPEVHRHIVGALEVLDAVEGEGSVRC